MTTCTLCKKDTLLLKRSHIIPDFFYRETNLFDDKHQLKLIQANQNTKKLDPLNKQNTGFYDKNILCPNCDNNIIGRLESYLKPLLFGGNIGIVDNPIFKNYRDTKGRPFVQCTNISYDKAKLALLSILWRGSISRNKFFREMKLNPEPQEELRCMILNNDPKEINKYPIVCLSILGQNKSFNEVIAEPKKFNHHKGTGVSILTGGIFILFYLSHTFSDIELERYSISPNRTMTIIEIDDGKGLDWILTYIGLVK
jgi:hypothetical protein